MDAAFGVVEGLDRRLLLKESIRAAFIRLLQEDTETPAHAALVETVRLLGKPAMLELVTRVVEERETWERWHGDGGLYTLPDEEILSRWDSAIDDYVTAMFSSRIVLADLERLAASADGKGAGALQRLVRECVSATHGAERARLFSEILPLALTTAGDLAKRVFATGHEGLQDVAHRLWRWRKDLLPLVLHVSDRSGAGPHRVLLEASRSVLRVAREAVEIYTARKADSGQLDFEDLQLYTRRLLTRAEVARSLSTRFRYFLVDEFQDTNRLQYEILLPLVQHLRGGNLFIVGDPKQSIYRFRNASVAVFQEARQAIVEVSGEASNIVLEESFRPLRELVAFVNLVFGPTMGAQSEDLSPLSAMEVSYEPLVQARAGPHSGRVELLLMDSDGQGNLAEAALLARRILQLHSSGFAVSGRDDHPRPMRFADVAILLRNRTVLPEVEQALAQHGIPFVVNAGTGYFQTQDVLDIYSFLRVLVHPWDDAALTGVLRSPFFGVSDAELFEACVERPAGSLWNHLRGRGTGDLTGGLQRALEMLQDLRSQAGARTVPEVLGLIVSSTMYESKLHGIPGGEQALANLEKLRAMARRSHLPGFLTLHDFVARLGQLIEQEEHEGQGTMEGSGNAVQVMTIHAAKGLEFPVVALPFLHRSFRLDSQPFVDDYLGLGFAFDDQEGVKTSVPVTLLSREVNRRRSVAEEKRVAYVAATRARDALLLSGAPSEARDTENVLAWILQALEVDPAEGSGTVERRVDLELLLPVQGEFSRETLTHNFRLVVLRPGDVPTFSAGAAEPSPVTVRPRNLTGPLKPSPVQEFLSATRLRVYRECPRLYYLRYILGYPGLSPIPAPADQDELSEVRVIPGAFGRAFHAVMQSIDGLNGSADHIRAEAMRTLAQEQDVAPDAIDQQAEVLSQEVLTVMRSSTWESVIRGTDSRTEFTISAPLGADYMVGTMDRIFRDGEGVWNLLDYKTDRLAREQVPDRATDYLPQLQFYAVLLAKYFGASTVRATLLFTVAPEDPIRYEFSAGNLGEIEQGILRDMERIRRGEFPPASTRCAQCPYVGQGCLTSHL